MCTDPRAGKRTWTVTYHMEDEEGDQVVIGRTLVCAWKDIVAEVAKADPTADLESIRVR